MLNLRALLEGMPSVLQYVIVLGLVMALLYFALWLTRRIGAQFKDSEKITFDDPEKYADSVPDLFATTQFRKKNAGKSGKDAPMQASESDSQEQEQDSEQDSDRD